MKALHNSLASPPSRAPHGKACTHPSYYISSLKPLLTAIRTPTHPVRIARKCPFCCSIPAVFALKTFCFAINDLIFCAGLNEVSYLNPDLAGLQHSAAFKLILIQLNLNYPIQRLQYRKCSTQNQGEISAVAIMMLPAWIWLSFFLFPLLSTSLYTPGETDIQPIQKGANRTTAKEKLGNNRLHSMHSFV